MKTPGGKSLCCTLLPAVVGLAFWTCPALAGSGPQTPAAGPTSMVKVELLNPPPSGFPWKDAAAPLVALASTLVAAFALRVSRQNTDRTVAAAAETARAQRQREANRAELVRLEVLISNFHMPYLVRTRANNNMAQDLRDRLRDESYRLLISLFEPGWLRSLPRGDQTLVREICATGLQLREFIEEHSGDIDPALADHLARASTHFRTLWLAYRHRLGDDPKPFERYVYPTQLDVALEADLTRIKDRMRDLRADPEKEHPAMPPLSLPPNAILPPWPNPKRH